MLSIIIVLGLLAIVDTLMIKFFIWRKIDDYSPNAPNMFIYRLTQCKFCMLFHISWILTVLYGLFAGFGWELITVPFVVSGLYKMRYNDI